MPGGVALGVLSFFALHVGLVQNGIVARGSAAYLVLLGAILAVQAATIALIAILAKNQLLRGGAAEAPAAVAPAVEAEAVRGAERA